MTFELRVQAVRILLESLIVPAIAIYDGGQAVQMSLFWDWLVSIHLVG